MAATPECVNWTHERVVDFLLAQNQTAHLDLFLDHGIDGPTLYKLCNPFINKVAWYQIFGLNDDNFFTWLGNQSQIAASPAGPLSSSGDIDMKSSTDSLSSSGPILRNSADTVPSETRDFSSVSPRSWPSSSALRFILLVYSNMSMFSHLRKVQFRCGYCKNGNNPAYCSNPPRLTTADYEELKDLNWTTSGTLAYRPVNGEGCCPHYQIRLKASEFAPTKMQRRVWKRVTNFVKFGTLPETEKPKERKEDAPKEQGTVQQRLSDVVASALATSLESVPPEVLAKSLDSHLSFSIRQAKDTKNPDGTHVQSLACGVIAFIAAETFPKAADIAEPADKKAKRDLKAKQAQARIEHTKSIFDKVLPALQALLGDNELWRSARVEFSPSGVLFFHLNIIDAPKYDAPKQGKFKASAASAQEQAPIHRLETSLHRPVFNQEVYNLYQRYQKIKHGDDETPDSYTNFLVQSPLIPEDDPSGQLPGLGRFHMHYRLDGRLIAVAVLDFLPRSLMSAYFFWEPDYEMLNLGTYSAMNEIKFCQDHPVLQYYYLGWYIHTNKRVGYKVSFHPTEILCPVTLTYVPFEKAKPLLDEYGYTALNPGAKVPKPAPTSAVDDQFIQVRYQTGEMNFIRFSEYEPYLDDHQLAQARAKLSTFLSYTGARIGRRLLLDSSELFTFTVKP